jgi:hypothetical protein
MATWKDLFGSEICSCGQKGEYVKANAKGQIVGWRCRLCYLEDKRKLDSKILKTAK